VWDPDRPTRLEVDASGYATGGVLLQKLEDDLWHPIAFRSQSMIEAERNYEIYDKKMLAIVRALEDWRHYLEGLPQIFDIILRSPKPRILAYSTEPHSPPSAMVPVS
jgi:hypothetical protein